MKRISGRQKPDKVTAVFISFIVFMAVYYGWRMFALTPWYDELYTYYYFISKGPLYAAIHWPLPNNHIGYSVLSACLGLLRNPSAALRGISWLSSLGSLILLFGIGRKCFGQCLALLPVFLFAGMKMVNQLAVQGRGYALVTFCYLTAICELLHIVVEHRDKKRDYLIFAGSLVLALYTIPSSVYVVVPVCLTGGFTLLINREYGRLVRLILTSAASAVCTAGLYGVVWLAIGSNLLVKTEGSGWYGMGHAAVILHAPLAAIETGIEYMLATPYIQNVGRKEFFEEFASWLRNLLNEYYPGGSVILAALLISCVVGVFLRIGGKLRRKTEGSKGEKPDYETFTEIYLAVSIVCIPLMLILQSSMPYYRVFSFAGVVVAFAAAWLVRNVRQCLQKSVGEYPDKYKVLWKHLSVTITAVCGILCVSLLLSASYRSQYSDREAAIEDAYAHAEWTSVRKTAVTDCDQEYLLLFLYGIGEDKIARRPEEADMVLADKYLLLGQENDGISFSADDWKLYVTEAEFAEFVKSAGLEPVYENDRFVLFQ